MLRTALILLLIVAFLPVSAQYAAQLSLLEKKVASAENDAERIVALADLAQLYATFNLSDKSDSVLQQALRIADLANDKSVITRMLVDNSIGSFNNFSDQSVYDKVISIVEKGIQYAREMHDSGLEVLGYIRLADIYRKSGHFDIALQNTSKATTALADNVADSINIELFCEMGKIYADQSDPVTAVRNYNKAFDIAYRSKNIPYQSKLYHLYSEIYRSFHTDKAKDYLLKSVELNKEYDNREGLYKDYFDLARLTDERGYIDMALKLAAEINSPLKIFKAKMLLYYWYMVIGRNSEQTFQYLNSNPDLSFYFNNINRSALCWERGTIYKYGGIYNSALDCFHASESDLLATRNSGRILDVNATLAGTYFQSGDTINATKYFENTYRIADSLNQPVYIDTAARNLSALYAMKNNYARAYYYRVKSDSLEAMFRENDARDQLVLLEIDRETKKGETDRQEAAHERTRQYNLQITAIRIVVTLFFFFILFLGMFEVSKAVIRTLGYFAFISLFEFILLLLDHPVMKLTKGEPLRLWFVKIALIALLVPFQHYLEKGLVKFLQSRKLLEVRKRFSFAELLKKKPVPKGESQVTEDEEGEIL